MAKNTQKFIAEVNLNGRPAINNLDKIQQAIKRLEKEAAKMSKGKNKDLLGAEKLKKEAKVLREVSANTVAEVKKVNSAFTTAGKSVAGLENALKLATEKYRRLTDATERNKMAMRIREIKTELNKMNQQLDVSNQKGNAFGCLFQRAAEYTGFYMSLNRGRQIITNAIQGNLQLSDSISDIQKVSGLSEEAVKGLISEIEKIDSRNTPEVLNNMAYAAGKLGIKGAENLLGFTRAADKLNVALKEYLGDGAEGVVRLMKFANVMGTTDMYGVEQALLKTGSALNYMTQSTAAAADYMIDFAARFGPVARAARMSTGDVIGLASALDALSLNNEVAATSLQKFTIKLLSSPVHVAKALGMDAESAKQMVETGKSIELVEMALEKLAERAQKFGVSGLTSVIGEIGSRGQAQRLIMTLQSLANNTKMVEEYVTMANDAFAKGTSVIDEYNIKNENAAAIWQRMKNSWQKVLVNSEQVGIVKELAVSFYDMSTKLQKSEVWMGSLKTSFKMLVGFFQILIKILPSLIILIAGLGFSKLANHILNAGMAMWQFIKAVKAGTITMKAFSAVTNANVFSVLIAAIPFVIQLFDSFGKKEDEVKNKTDHLRNSFTRFEGELNSTARAANQLFEQLKANNNSTSERTRIIAELNKNYGQYLNHMLHENSSLQEITKAQYEFNKQLRQTQAYKAKIAGIDEVNQRRGQDLAQNVYDLRALFSEGGAGRMFWGGRSLVGGNGVSFETSVQQAFNSIGDYLNSDKIAKADQETAVRNIWYLLEKQGFSVSKLNDVLHTPAPVYHLQKDNAGFGDTNPINPIYDKKGGYQKYLADYDLWKQQYNAAKSIQTQVRNIAWVGKKREEEIRQTEEFYQPFIGDYEPLESPTFGGDTTEVLEDFSKEQKEADAERRKAEAEARKEMEIESKAIKALIEAFYNHREAVIDDLHAAGEEGYKTAMERDAMIKENKVLQAEAINNAWKYLLGEEGGEALWKQQFANMKTQIIQDSKGLDEDLRKDLANIGEKDMTVLMNLIKNFGGKLVGEMRNTIAKNDKLIAASGSKVWEEFEKALDKHDYEEQVRKKYWNVLQQANLFRTKYEDGITDSFKSVNEAAAAGIDELAGMYDKVLAIDIKTTDGLDKFRALIQETKYLSQDMAEMSYQDLIKLYYAVYTLGEEMSNAGKKWVDFQKKVLEYRYKQTDQYKGNQQDQEDLQNLNTLTSAGVSKYGLENKSLTQDNEILLYAMKLQAATDYFNYLEQHNADAILLEQQRQEVMKNTLALQEKMASKMTIMQEWFKESMETLPAYGTALGEAFSKADPEERADAFKEAHKEILKSLGEATKKMIIEWVKQRIQHSLQQKLMVSEEQATDQQRLADTITAEVAIANAKKVVGQTVLATQQAQATESLTTEATETTGKVNLGIVGGAAKTISELGWWGIPLVAVITALLNGLLSWALGSLFKGKESSKSSDSSSKSALRLVEGMLVFDGGNVDQVLGGETNSRQRYLGSDGRTYRATPTVAPEGTALVHHPIATMIGGQPALVAEKGTELIIGRRDLRDMSQFRPDLLQQIMMFRKNRFKTYDEGNLGNFGVAMPSQQMGQQVEMMSVMTQTREVNEQLIEVIGALTAQIQKGIPSYIQKYGSGGLIEEVADGLYVTKRRGNNVNVRRLFGG